MIPFLLTLFLPLFGSVIILFFKREAKQLIKYFTLGFTTVIFLISLFIWFGFDATATGFQYYFDQTWIPAFDAGFRVGIDGMSLLLLMLTTFIMPIAVISSFGAIDKREKEYYAMLLLLEFAMIGVFISLDLFLFYIFWELILIPMYFIIGIWGGKNRIYAAIKFFLFTVVGSLIMLGGIIWLGYHVGTHILNIPSGFTTNFIVLREQLTANPLPLDVEKWLFIAFALSFAIKVPIFPLHTWLPDAHTEAPTPGSVILAGVLLKMGTYGLIRFNLDLFPHSTVEFAPIIATLAVIGIIYGALVSLVQTDVKRLVAYSSVSHLGFVILGIFSLTVEGIQGGIIQMVNHGLSTGMLFLCVGVLYERRHTRDISDYGGITRVMPRFAVMFSIAMLASVGLPGLNGFIGEYLTLFGAFRSETLATPVFSIVAATGVIFAAAYLLWMFQRVMYGEINNPLNQHLNDLKPREWASLLPIVLFIIWIGVCPSTFMNKSEKSTRILIEKYEKIRAGIINLNNTLK